jgi:SAM-dependent methyltransferase
MQAPSSAERWGPLWGARARDWAASEEQQIPTYEEALRRLPPLAAGDRVLDIGCGAGVFLRMLAERGARPAGLDASEALIDVARERVPDADLRVGAMESLPWPDGSFDLVAGFNAFFFADDIVAALREAGRVAKPGASVVIQVWGSPERCELEAVKRVLRPFMPAPPPSAGRPRPALHETGVLEGLASAAGLEPRLAFDHAWSYEFPDAETLGRLLVAPAGVAETAGPEREAGLRAEIADAVADRRMPGGRYRLRNEFHFLIARARI